MQVQAPNCLKLLWSKAMVVSLGGIRHKGSANLIQALVWNVGTCRSDDKGEIQVEETTRMRVPMRKTGTDQLVVVLKFL
jgi:hypothetical protein